MNKECEQESHCCNNIKNIANNLRSGVAIAHRVSWFSVFIVESAFMVPFLGLPFVLLVNNLSFQTVHIVIMVIIGVLSLICTPLIVLIIYFKKIYQFFMKDGDKLYIMDFKPNSISFYDGDCFFDIRKKDGKYNAKKRDAKIYENAYFPFKFDAFAYGEFNKIIGYYYKGHSDFSGNISEDKIRFDACCPQTLKINSKGKLIYFRNIIIFQYIRNYHYLTYKYYKLNEPNFKFPLPNILKQAFEKYHLPIPSNVFDLEHKSHLKLLNKIDRTLIQ